MKAAILEGKRKLVVREVPEPVLGRDEVLIKVHYCGICGSDLHIYREGALIGLGHEFSGDIVEVGPDVKGWEIGNRVVVDPHRACGRCYWCRRGYESGACEQFYVDLLQRQSAFATYTKTKYDQLYKLPDDLSYELAALVEPTTCPLHAIRASGMQIGDVVAVLGLGPIGQLVARLAKVSGARVVYATEASQSRVKLATNAVDEVINITETNPAERIFELTNGMGADIVFECAGSISATQQAMALVRKGGTIVLVGICMEAVEAPFSQIVLKRLTLKGFVGWSIGDFAAAFSIIKDKKIDVAPLITSRMPLSDIGEAFEKALRGEEGVILVKP